eukprot:12435183-Prorocentrum_lima.AAC.1
MGEILLGVRATSKQEQPEEFLKIHAITPDQVDEKGVAIDISIKEMTKHKQVPWTPTREQYAD